MDSLAQPLLALAVLIGLLALGLRIARKYRDDADENQRQGSELFTKFRELHSQGDLSDEEFRTVKTKLAGQLQEELRDTDETG